MADNVRVTKTAAHVRTLANTDRVDVTKSVSYVKIRRSSQDIRASAISAYVKVAKPWPTEKRSRFYIDGVELPNPIRVMVDSHPVIVTNIAAGGKVHYGFRAEATQKNIHTIEVEWGFLTTAERSLIRTQWELTALGYASLKMEMIALWVLDETGTAIRFNTMDVISAPNSPAQETYQTGYLYEFNRDVTGPVLYNFKATFLTRPGIQLAAVEPYINEPT